MDGYFTNCLSRGINLEGKSNNRRSPRVHKASAMLWRKGHNPSLFVQIIKFGFLSMFILVFLEVFLPLSCQFLRRMGHLLMMCNQILVVTHTFAITELLQRLQTSWSLLGPGVEVGLTPSFID
jgi:hypothetical protein